MFGLVISFVTSLIILSKLLSKDIMALTVFTKPGNVKLETLSLTTDSHVTTDGAIII